MKITNISGLLANGTTTTFSYFSNLGVRTSAITAIAIGALTYAAYKAAPWAARQIQYHRMLLAAPAPVATALWYLHDSIPALMTQENGYALFQSGANAFGVAYGLVNLHNANPALVTQENRNALVQSGANTFFVASGLIDLHNENPALVSKKYRDALIQSGANAGCVARALCYLHRYNPALATQKNLNALVQSGANAFDVAIGLANLHNANPVLVKKENRDVLIQSGANATKVARELIHLHNNYPHLMTQENYDALIQSGENMYEIMLGLRQLHNSNLLNDRNFQLLFDRDEISGKIEPLLLTKKNFYQHFELDLFEKNIMLGGSHILYPTKNGSEEVPLSTPECPVPNRKLPIPLTQQSLETWRNVWMAAKWHPNSPAAAKDRALAWA